MNNVDNFDNFRFVMQLNDVLNLGDIGVILNGPILKGDIKEKDTIYYIDKDKKIKSNVERLEVFGRIGDGTAHSGEFISIAQHSITKEDITGDGYIVIEKV